MTKTITADDRVRDYVQRLTPQARSRLLDELERLHLAGDDIRGSEALLAELRAEFRRSGQRHDRISNPSRYFFQPLEPVLVDHAPERANSGQISRTSLSAIWEWIAECLLPTMAREYDAQMKHVILANNPAESRKTAAAFQAKVAKCLESALIGEGLERTRNEFARFTVSDGVVGDLTKMQSVLRASEALSRFQTALPREIDVFEGELLARVQEPLNKLTTQHAEAMPFALTVIMKRLKTPWQLIHLATKAAKSRKAADIAAMPCAIGISMVLDHLDDRRHALHAALTSDSILIAKDILVDIYDIEHALRVQIDRLEGTAWGRRLNDLMAAMAADLDVELHKLPDNVHHVLASRKLHHRETVFARLVSLLRIGHNLVRRGAAYCRDLLASGRRPADQERGRSS